MKIKEPVFYSRYRKAYDVCHWHTTEHCIGALHRFPQGIKE